jgi:hypothetical protein
MRIMAGLVVAIAGCGLAILTGSRLAEHIRLVDMLTLFGAGCAAGAGVVGTVIRYRLSRGPVA